LWEEGKDTGENGRSQGKVRGSNLLQSPDVTMGEKRAVGRKTITTVSCGGLLKQPPAKKGGKIGFGG